MKDLAHLESSGQLFGYPSCCIQDFLVRARSFALGEREPVHPFKALMGCGVGYLPCLSHAQMIWEAAPLERQKRIEFIRTILVRRAFPLPFPHDELTLANVALNPRSRRLDGPEFEPELRAALWLYGAVLRGDLFLPRALMEHSKRTWAHLYLLLLESAFLGSKLPGADHRRDLARKDLHKLLFAEVGTDRLGECRRVVTLP